MSIHEKTDSHCEAIDWFFDFISPFAYIQHKQLEKKIRRYPSIIGPFCSLDCSNTGRIEAQRKFLRNAP